MPISNLTIYHQDVVTFLSGVCFPTKFPVEVCVYEKCSCKNKLKTNQMGIYCVNENIIHYFLFDKTIGTIGPNEVLSLLDYLVVQLENKLRTQEHIIVWSDSSLASSNNASCSSSWTT